MSDPDRIAEVTERLDAMQRRIEHQIDFSIELLRFLALKGHITNYQAMLLVEGGVARDPNVINQFDGMGRQKWIDARNHFIDED